MRIGWRGRWARDLCIAGALLFTQCGDSQPVPGAAPHPSVQQPSASAPEALAPEVRRAFEPQAGFKPLPKPRPGEWLDRHPEPGQSVTQFERSARVVPTTERRTLFILPIGRFESGLSPRLSTLADYVQRFIGLPVQVLPAVADGTLPARKRTHGGVEQLLTGDLLEALRARVPPAAYGLVGVTMSDLFPAPRWNYVFGEARFTERVGVYSFARYDPHFHGEPREPTAAHLILERSLKVMTHEIGHMFGVEHCTAYLCVMNGSNSLEETDRAPMHMCPVCLRKLHLAVGFSPTERYGALAAFYRAHAFSAEAQWVGDRLRYLREPGERTLGPPR
jgi:archaemetzincin